MSYAPSVIERLQLDLGAILMASPFFNDIPVNIARLRVDNTAVMIQDRINLALQGLVTQNGGTGVTAVVEMPEGEVPFPETPGPDLRLVCKVRVIENPLVNMGPLGTLKSAEDVMLWVLSLLHLRYWQDSGSTLVADKNAFRPLADYLQKDYVGYECRFLMRMGLGGLQKTPLPAIAGNSEDGVTITGSGSIYYTTDGSYPSPQNSGAVLSNPALLNELTGDPILNETTGDALLAETMPISVSAGTLVRAVAYVTNQQASDLAAQVIS